MNTINNCAKVFQSQGIPLFDLKDCALIATATNRQANTLKELRDHIVGLNPDSLYFHFWGNLLLPRFEGRGHNNDFASWVRYRLHDAKLAEQLGLLDPTTFNDLNGLRQRLLRHIDDRLKEGEYLYWFQATQPFEFIRSQIVVFDTPIYLETPADLARYIPCMSVSSMFYHFIDARRRSRDKVDDFRYWLACFGDTYQLLIEHLSYIDPYFNSLIELRQQVATAFNRYFPEEMR